MTRLSGIVATLDAFKSRYAVQGDMPALSGGQVIAKPPFVLGPDDALLWPFSPQLKRTPETCDAHWKDLSSPVRVVGRSLYAVVDGFSYYHWIVGTLPKLLHAKQAEVAWGGLTKIFVNPKNKGGFQEETLALLGIPSEKVVHVGRGQHFRCDELILPPEPCAHDQTMLLEWARGSLRDAFLAGARAAHPQPLPKRIYVSRAQARRRRLVNENDVIAVLAERGYRHVVLEGMPFATQVALFDQAEEIIGLHGAGLVNAVFSRPGARIVEIMPETCANRCFAELAKGGGLEYAVVTAPVVTGESSHTADATVDVAALQTVIASGAKELDRPLR